MGTRDDFKSKTHMDEHYSIPRNCEIFNYGFDSTGKPGMSTYGESSDVYYSATSDSDMLMNERCKNDAKLRKRCTVVITPTKELIQYQRKRDKMYNEILQKQRRKIEQRALEKQREKERRRLDRREEKMEQTITNDISHKTTASDKTITCFRRTRNDSESFMSHESEYETHFQVRTRKYREENVKELKPLNIQIEMAENTTTTLLSQIDDHLDRPAADIPNQCEVKEHLQEQQANNSDIYQHTCDITSDKGQPKMRELNLLADIAQHLSPYQLDLPDNNNPLRTPSPASEPPLLLPAPNAPNKVPKEKVTVTEHIIIQPLDNLLHKENPQLNYNNQQEQATISYAHEPKLNIATVFKSSHFANLLQTSNQQSNTQTENYDNSSRNSSTAKEINPKIQTTETLEQILEESMSVLKSVTSPLNPLKECTSMQPQPQPHSVSSIPLLISNVESLNPFEQDDATGLLIPKDSTMTNSENVVLTENELINKEADERTKDELVEQEENFERNKTTILSSHNLNTAESSIMCANNLANLPNETETSQTLEKQPLMASDLSDISIESEISKHLPEIAEPSPVVTDMSDNSNESDLSKGFELHTPSINNSIANASGVTELTIPDLSVVMSNIAEPQTMLVSEHETLESGSTQLNCSLNTPTKFSAAISREKEETNSSTNDECTPLKFALQPELESNNMRPKIALEPESDNNVTKFLDLILNKTVTDAESETRDKIIKELNALTADTIATNTIESCGNNNEIIQQESKLNESERNVTMDPEKSVEKNKSLEDEKSIENGNIIKKQERLNTYTFNSHQTFDKHIENNFSATEISESKTTSLKEQIPSANNDLSPPKENSREEELLSDIITLSSLPKTISPAMKQTFNIKCRVRLKRLNIDDCCKTTKTDTWMAIPISKPEEHVSSINCISKCDNFTEPMSAAKKPCLKYNNRHGNDRLEEKIMESITDANTALDVIPAKKAKLEIEQSTAVEATQIPTSQQPLIQALTQPSQALLDLTLNSPSTTKSKSKTLKTVTFDLSNLNEELRDNHRIKSKSHAAGISADALGCYLKNSRPPRKLPDNTLRAAETLQIFVNTINDSTRTPPPAEFNKKRSPIKNKCIAEDETPRPPPASTLMDTPPCKKTCTDKSRSQITSSKCKDQLVSSLTTPSISNITSDITTARIYTSSPLDQTLPEYDDNVDTVADSELILPTTTGSLRRKLKRPKKSLTRPEPPDDIITDDISNQPECNGEDDTDAVADNEDDVFAEELLPIPAANEHILEEIVSARPSHIGTGTVIRDDYMNIEATATVPVYLFNDESRDLPTPEPLQSGDTTNVVDSSSYLNTSSSIPANSVVAATPARTTSAMGNLEKSMLSPSEHEVSSTQETFYLTPTKNKQTEIFGEKSSTSKDKGNSSSSIMNCSILKQNPEDNSFQNKEDCQTSSTIGLLQNNQVDTTNHSPEMCTIALTATTTTTTTIASNRKIRKASTHDEILFNELQQQQLPSNKRNHNKLAKTFCAESTSDNTTSKCKMLSNNLEDAKSNGSLIKVKDKFKKLLKEVCKRDKHQIVNELDVTEVDAGNNTGGGGGSSPSTTTTINEEKLSKSKRKKQKSSKSSKTKSHNERSSKIILKASKLTPHTPVNPLIITIPKSRLLRPPSTPTPPTPIEPQDEQQSEFFDIPNAKLFIERAKETTTKSPEDRQHHQDQYNQGSETGSMVKAEISKTAKRAQSPVNTITEIVNMKANKVVEAAMNEVIRYTSSAGTTKKKSSSSSLKQKKDQLKTSNNTNFSSTTCTNSNNNNLIFVKDKYDLIKSKDKHYHCRDDQNDIKEKFKDNIRIQAKAVTSNNTRLHKNSTKEKIKGEKLKEKHKSAEKLATQQQPDVLKIMTSQSNNKALSSPLSTSTVSFSSSNNKQSRKKSSKTSSSSSSSSSSSNSAILKSKTNLSTTQPSATSTGTGLSQINTVTISTPNVRKKFKIK